MNNCQCQRESTTVEIIFYSSFFFFLIVRNVLVVVRVNNVPVTVDQDRRIFLVFDWKMFLRGLCGRKASLVRFSHSTIPNTKKVQDISEANVGETVRIKAR